ncbi:DUF7551 domain-containing protein [Natronosalvus halobius]|uniref:DUF7551 domain-containing protein n=1 Tax=Natronosalvus halobius TaxID=2953746 RepID=UPI00209F6095|nr:hypothetical protein [Natronosalvus halobius]USZ70571.1 hypothetical protein NGM15_10675 [Natronosalvus halobius]
MVGTTLQAIRTHLEGLASEGGEYSLVCARYGDRPVPAADLRFESRATARLAARATEQYRDTLRRYDPQLPYYDVIVRQEHPPGDWAVIGDQNSSTRPASGVASNASSKSDAGRWTGEGRDLVEFCHRVAGAAFETMSTHGYDALESAVMDAYLALAERLSSPDGLCLCLLESTAIELATRLSPTDQVTFLSATAARLNVSDDPSVDPSHGRVERSIDGSLSRLRAVGILETFECVRTGPTETTPASRRAVIDLGEYALSPNEGRLPLLPVVVEWYRCQQAWLPVSATASDSTNGWRVEVVDRPERLEVAVVDRAKSPLAPRIS